MSTDSTAIALYRERSVTGVINATFRFLRSHFRPLVKSLLLLAGPALIIANVVAFYATGPQGALRPGLFLVQMGFTLIGSVIATAVTIGAVAISDVEGPSSLTTGRLWGAVRTHWLALFGRQLQIGVIIAVGGIFTGLALGIIIGSLGIYSEGSVASAFVVGGIFFLFFLGFLLYVGPTFMLLMPGQVDSERRISLMRCVRLVKGRWGQTLGVWLLASIITMVLFSVGWIPRFVINLLTAVGSNPTGTTGVVLAGTIAGVANALAPAVTYTAITVQYYNLVEQKEHVSLEEEVGRIEEEADTSDAEWTAEAERNKTGETDRTSDAEPFETEDSSPDPTSEEDARWRGEGPSA